jgi:cytochrome c oxidase assembly protein subunit 11
MILNRLTSLRRLMPSYNGPLNFCPNNRLTGLNSRQSSSSSKKLLGEKTGFYMASVAVGMFGASFAAVPLYRLYCQTTGKGGQAFKEDENKIANLNVDTSRTITVKFDAKTHSSMDWNFSPVQNQIKVHPGETALAFYRVKNPLDETVIGVATYTVLPYEAGQYFNKIQCFCFEEQMLKPHEDIFMPVLFYIDPEFSKDPQLANMSDVVLSYTFFRSKDGELLDTDEEIELKKHGK